MKLKSGHVTAILLLSVAASCVAQSVEAPLTSTEGILRGRGFIYLTDYPYEIGYVDISIRAQSMRHTGLLRVRAFFEYTVFTEDYRDPIRTLRDAAVSLFYVEPHSFGYMATVMGTATYQEGTTSGTAGFQAIFVDADGDGYVERFTISYPGHDDVPFDMSAVQGKIALKP